ncbi:MAG: hypothetical protein ACI9YT_001535 [Halobacteriales archaeon]|jgi:hypothetical protein
MSSDRLFKLPLDPDSIDDVRSHSDRLEEQRGTFERGLAIEKMNAETAWLDEDEPALYYLHDESEDYPADVEKDDTDDEAVLALSAEHHEMFQKVAREGYSHPDDLVEFEMLFRASARDRID